VIQPSLAYLQVQFRLGYNDGRTSPFADEQVRKAVRYAIDAERINELVQLGEGEVATQSLPESSPGYDPALADAYPYDPEEAKRLLAEAGYPDGFEFTMVIPGPGIENMQRQGELIQSMLADVGITANIKPVSGSDIATNYYINGGGDAFAAARLASSFYPGAYHDAYAPFQFVAIWNQTEREDIGDIASQALAATDDAETAQLTRQAAKIVSDEAMEVPIAFMPQFLATNKDRVGGVVGGQRDICDRPDLSQATVITGKE
jgi:peptide/nickel transport system substrate-binding protein